VFAAFQAILSWRQPRRLVSILTHGWRILMTYVIPHKRYHIK